MTYWHDKVDLVKAVIRCIERGQDLVINFACHKEFNFEDVGYVYSEIVANGVDKFIEDHELEGLI